MTTGRESATHIRLVCWDHHHVQAISAAQLRQIVIAPFCTARIDGGLCGSAIWAVEHDGEPTRYIGRPPNHNWQKWADCSPPPASPNPQVQNGDDQ